MALYGAVDGGCARVLVYPSPANGIVWLTSLRLRMLVAQLLILTYLLTWSPISYSQAQPDSPHQGHSVFIPIISTEVKQELQSPSGIPSTNDNEVDTSNKGDTETSNSDSNDNIDNTDNIDTSNSDNTDTQNSDDIGISPVKPECSFNAEEQIVANKLIEDPNQNRPTLTCDPILLDVARARAQDMAIRDYYGHINPDGLGPNVMVVQAGYTLPESYSSALEANEVESIAAGSSTPADVWSRWMQSEPHRDHLLATKEKFLSQTVFGVGYVYVSDSLYKHYWVVITAPPREPQTQSAATPHAES